MQAYTNTTYIEKIPSKNLEKAVLRAYTYNKSLKERLSKHITRFELKLQPKYFHKYSFNITSIEKALSRYYVMYFKNSHEKTRIIEAYERYQLFRKREIDRLNLEKYRLNPDITKIKSFLEQLLNINDFDIWCMYELPMYNIHNKGSNIF